jgi:putative mRNA 3-end processing factor
MADLVVSRPEGLYCPPGRFFIDPWKPVDRAVITHAHGDHARPGSARYLASATPRRCSAPGSARTCALDTLAYGERVVHDGA